MKVSDALKARRSTRAYKDQQVDQELIEKIFSEAQLSPSNCNTQPWHTVVVSGEACDKLRKAMVGEIVGGATPSPHFTPGDHELKDEYRTRQIECAVALYDSVGVTREDKQKRQELMLQNWQFFGAPHAAFFSMPKSMSEVNAVDMGIYLQSLMLLMTEYGLASCPQGALAFFPNEIHKIADIPEGNAIMFGLSFGYADTDHSINQFGLPRADLSDCVQFIS